MKFCVLVIVNAIFDILIVVGVGAANINDMTARLLSIFFLLFMIYECESYGIYSTAISSPIKTVHQRKERIIELLILSKKSDHVMKMKPYERHRNSTAKLNKNLTIFCFQKNRDRKRGKNVVLSLC